MLKDSLNDLPAAKQTGIGTAAARRAGLSALRMLAKVGPAGKKLADELAARQKTSLVGKTVEDIYDLAVLAQVYRDPRFETLRLFFTDDWGRLVSQVGLTSRLPAAAPGFVGDNFDEYLRQVSETAQSLGATGFYMLHNHPSGVSRPSAADRGASQLFAARMPGLAFHGHVVIDTDEYSVIDRQGRFQTNYLNGAPPESFAVPGWADLILRGPADLMTLVKKIEVDPHAVALVVTSSRLEVRNVVTVPGAAIGPDQANNRRFLLRMAMSGLGNKVFAVSHDQESLLRLDGLIADGIHIAEDGSPESLYGAGRLQEGELFPAGRRVRVTEDTSPEFGYLRSMAAMNTDPQNLTFESKHEVNNMAEMEKTRKWLDLSRFGARLGVNDESKTMFLRIIDLKAFRRAVSVNFVAALRQAGFDVDGAIIEGRTLVSGQASVPIQAMRAIFPGIDRQDFKETSLTEIAEVSIAPAPADAETRTAERIVAVAVRDGEGSIYAAPDQGHLELYQAAGMTPVKMTAAEITAATGFLTSEGRFVLQAEADRIHGLVGDDHLTGEFIEPSTAGPPPGFLAVPGETIWRRAEDMLRDGVGDLELMDRSVPEEEAVNRLLAKAGTKDALVVYQRKLQAFIASPAFKHQTPDFQDKCVATEFWLHRAVMFTAARETGGARFPLSPAMADLKAKTLAQLSTKGASSMYEGCEVMVILNPDGKSHSYRLTMRGVRVEPDLELPVDQARERAAEAFSLVAASPAGKTLAECEEIANRKAWAIFGARPETNNEHTRLALGLIEALKRNEGLAAVKSVIGHEPGWGDTMDLALMVPVDGPKSITDPGLFPAIAATMRERIEGVWGKLPAKVAEAPATTVKHLQAIEAAGQRLAAWDRDIAGLRTIAEIFLHTAPIDAAPVRRLLLDKRDALVAEVAKADTDYEKLHEKREENYQTALKAAFVGPDTFDAKKPGLDEIGLSQKNWKFFPVQWGGKTAWSNGTLLDRGEPDYKDFLKNRQNIKEWKDDPAKQYAVDSMVGDIALTPENSLTFVACRRALPDDAVEFEPHASGPGIFPEEELVCLAQPRGDLTLVDPVHIRYFLSKYGQDIAFFQDTRYGTHEGMPIAVRKTTGNGEVVGMFKPFQRRNHEWGLTIDEIKDYLPEKIEPPAVKLKRKLEQGAASPAVSDKIEDVGEKIGGARKDLAGRRLFVSDLDKMNEGERRELVKKDKVFPPFDYSAMKEAGVDPAVAIYLKLLRDRLPVTPYKETLLVGIEWEEGKKPSYKFDYSPEIYVAVLGDIHDAVQGVKTEEDLRSAILKIESMWEETPLGEEYRRKAMRVQAGDSESPGRADYLRARGSRDVVGKVYNVVGFFSQYFSRAQYEAKKHGWSKLIRTRTKQDKLTDQAGEEAGDRIPKRPHLEKITRTGLPDYREKRDVTAEELMTAFGCRGIEFGNWLPQDERQMVVNHAYDALADLAATIGIKKDEIGLAGDLALAFGARGNGGRHSAHYEPARRVINLTRIRGGGSLAHECAHAIDHFIAGQAGHGVMAFKSGCSHNRGIKSGSPLFQGLEEKFHEVMRVISQKPMAPEDRAMDCQAAVDKYTDWAKSWINPWAVKIKDDDARKKFRETAATMIQQVSDGKVLPIKAFEGVFIGRGAKEMRAEDDPCECAVSRIIGAFREAAPKTSVPDKPLRALEANLAAVARSRDWLDSYKADPEKVKAEMQGTSKTAYLKNAEKLDQKRSGSYWAQPHELFARAFEAWAFDRIGGQDKNGCSDYLVSGVEESRFEGQIYRGNPYPAGQERKQINAAMDRLMESFAQYVRENRIDNGAEKRRSEEMRVAA